MSRRQLAVLLATMTLVASCGAEPQPSATPTVTAAPETLTSTPTRSPLPPAPTQSATPSPSPTSAALPQGDDPVTLDPSDFVTGVDHPFWPMQPGNRWVYRETDEEGVAQNVEVTVTAETKQIMGITAIVVHDVVTEDGELIEDTFDWYAQDSAGNVWYMGEATIEYDGELSSTAGSWEAGVNGARPGILLPAQPQVGMTYRQEYYAGEAEDAADVVSLDEWVEVPAGSYSGVLMTREYTPLDPAILEHKFYAPGVGPVLVLGISGGSSREELTEFTVGGPD